MKGKQFQADTALGSPCCTSTHCRASEAQPPVSAVPGNRQSIQSKMTLYRAVPGDCCTQYPNECLGCSTGSWESLQLALDLLLSHTATAACCWRCEPSWGLSAPGRHSHSSAEHSLRGLDAPASTLSACSAAQLSGRTLTPSPGTRRSRRACAKRLQRSIAATAAVQQAAHESAHSTPSILSSTSM